MERLAGHDATRRRANYGRLDRGDEGGRSCGSGGDRGCRWVVFRAEARRGDGGFAGLLLLMLLGFQNAQLRLGALQFDVFLLEPKL